MADTPWPSVEAALIDHLPTVTPIDWEAPGRSEPGARVPLGVVEQVGGIQDVGLDKQATVEVTVYAARRPGCWQLASAIDIDAPRPESWRRGQRLHRRNTAGVRLGDRSRPGWRRLPGGHRHVHTDGPTPRSRGHDRRRQQWLTST